ncbi:MAG: hypothetical protein MK135_04450 [Polyangiaceae bacterium]|nr:hypothetical protein [Polyangiaceae bacterium]
MSFTLFLSGCRCASDSASTTPPLESVELPAHGAALLIPQLGVTTPVPVLIALAPESECQRLSQLKAYSFHLLCSPRGDGQAIRGLLKEFRSKYSPYLAASPVVLLALDAPMSRRARELALENPAFFGHLILSEASQLNISNTFVYTYRERGGQSLFLIGVNAANFVKESEQAERKGLLLRTYQGSAEQPAGQLEQVFSEIVGIDPRFLPRSNKKRP